VTWDPSGHKTDGVTVSLVLCHGPSSNCVPSDTAIVEGLPAAQKSYQWSVPSDLAPGKQSTDTGYGMLIIVDGTGEFQYSTQFSVLAGKSSGSTTSSAKPTVSTNSAGSIILGPPAQQTGSALGTTTAYSNGTVATTRSGTWGSTATTTTTTGEPFSFGTGESTYASTLATQTTRPVGTNAAATGGSSTTSSSGSTFTGAADRASLNVAGLAIAGALAVFAL